MDINNIHPVFDSHVELRKKVGELVTRGGTGLGPALAVAVGIASKIPRSEVIVCTDGEPNKGLGSLPADPGFYEEIGIVAKENSTTISILGIEGAGQAMNMLSKCSELSNGTVNLINPLELTRQMRNIIDNSSTAIEVSVSVYFPLGIKERGVKNDDNDFNILKVPIGNINSGSCFTVDFGIVDKLLDEVKDKERVPIQVQIDYTKLNGEIYKRVEQLWCRLSSDRESVEQSCDTATIGLHAIKKSGTLAYSNPKEAKYTLTSYQSLLDRVMSGDKMEEYTCYVTTSEELDTALDQVIQNNGNIYGNLVNTLFKFRNSHKLTFLSTDRKQSYVETLKKHIGEAKQIIDLHGG